MKKKLPKEAVLKNLKKKTKEPTPAGGLTYEQIAKQLGLTKQGVRRIEKRAIRKIKKKLKIEYGFDLAHVKDVLLGF